MEKQKEIERYLSCLICNQKFNKNNKPLIMFCGHNICEECRLKYRKKVKCITCGKVFSKREIKKFPINYSILENKLISGTEENKSPIGSNEEDKKDINTNKEDIETLKNLSSQTYLSFMSSFMKEVTKYIYQKENNNNDIKNEIIEEKKDPCGEIIKEREIIIKDTSDLLDKLENNFMNYLKIFFDSITNKFKINPEFLIGDLNICQLLEESGVINYGDYKKLEQFLDIINEIDETKLKNCASFNDIYDLAKEKNKDISYNQFISLFFFFNKIFELKIKKIPKTFEEQKKLYTNDKDNNKNLIHLINSVAQKYDEKLSDIINDITIYKTSHFIYDLNKNENIKKSFNNFYTKNEKLFEVFNNAILIYEPIQKSLNIQILKIKELKDEEIIDSYLILNQLLFILTNKKFYVYDINLEKYSFFNTIENQEIEKDTKIFKYDTSIMKISSNYFECINLRNDMQKNEWRSLSLFQNTPGQIKKPYPICHSLYHVYVLNKEEKNINNIYLYNAELDSWEKKKIKFEIKSKDEEKKKAKDNRIDQNNKQKDNISTDIINKEKDSISNDIINKDKEKDSINNDIINSDKENEELIILKNLYLEDYFFFNKCFACIFGGRHPTTKKFNKSVYMIDTVKEIINEIIKFDDFISDDMTVINLNVGILNKYVDFIFVYHYINEESNIKIKIIRKEVIENDISIDSKLKVVTDINISDISNDI